MKWDVEHGFATTVLKAKHKWSNDYQEEDVPKHSRSRLVKSKSHSSGCFVCFWMFKAFWNFLKGHRMIAYGCKRSLQLELQNIKERNRRLKKWKIFHETVLRTLTKTLATASLRVLLSTTILLVSPLIEQELFFRLSEKSSGITFRS